MATRIRLKRMGRRNRPFFRVVVMDSHSRRDGAAIEEVGWYDPISKDDRFSLKEDRILYWLLQGAQPTETVRNLMRKAGLVYRWHLTRQGLSEKEIDYEIQKWKLDREELERKRAEKREKKAEVKVKSDGEAEAIVGAKMHAEEKVVAEAEEDGETSGQATESTGGAKGSSLSDVESDETAEEKDI